MKSRLLDVGFTRNEVGSQCSLLESSTRLCSTTALEFNRSTSIIYCVKIHHSSYAIHDVPGVLLNILPPGIPSFFFLTLSRAISRLG